MNRRELFAKVPLFPLSAVAFGLLSSCGGGGDSGGDSTTVAPQSTPTGCKGNGATTVVGNSDGHSHPTTMIPSTEIMNGATQIYASADGGSGHTHNFTLQASHFATLQANSSITIVSDPDGTGHSHAIMVSCI